VGTVFKLTVTKSLPAGAETCTRKGQRFARWKDRNGKTWTVPLTTGKDGSDRLVIESARLQIQGAIAGCSNCSPAVHRSTAAAEDHRDGRAFLGLPPV
jgi:hypothetical protein